MALHLTSPHGGRARGAPRRPRVECTRGAARRVDVSAARDLALHQPDERRSRTSDRHDSIDLAGPSRVLIIRRDSHVELRELPAGEFASWTRSPVANRC
jgi:hypothetical protein